MDDDDVTKKFFKSDDLIICGPAVTTFDWNILMKGVNFTMFPTMMGGHLLELDSEAELLEAFESFDENDDGKVKCNQICKWLSEVGDQMDQFEACFLSKMNKWVLRYFHLLRSTNFWRVPSQIVKGISTTKNGLRYYKWMQMKMRKVKVWNYNNQIIPVIIVYTHQFTLCGPLEPHLELHIHMLLHHITHFPPRFCNGISSIGVRYLWIWIPMAKGFIEQ